MTTDVRTILWHNSSTVRDCLSMMIDWVHNYISHADYNRVSAAHHGPFYSVCQAIFYVFAFKHRELLAMPKGEMISYSALFTHLFACPFTRNSKAKSSNIHKDM